MADQHSDDERREQIRESFEKARRGMLRERGQVPAVPVLKLAMDQAEVAGLERETALMYACVQLHTTLSQLNEQIQEMVLAQPVQISADDFGDLNDEYITELERALEQAINDLNDAHDEIMKQQGLELEEARKRDWPEWSFPANTVRWAEDLLEKRLAKTTLWTTRPDEENDYKSTKTPESNG